jgi:hypothetical protein
MREMQAMSRGLVAEVDEQVEAIRQKSLAAHRPPQAELRRTGGRQAPAAVKPPCSPTGVKSPAKGKSQGRKAA